MIAENVSFLIAFGAGVASFLSPCILPMIPAYIMYMTGSQVETNADSRKKSILRTLVFVLGFTIIFVIMGSSASVIGKAFAQNRIFFTKLSGVVIVLFGLKMTGKISLGFLSREKKLEAPKVVNSWSGALLMGIAFAAGWTPCFGPILASILIFAGASDTVLHGTLLLLVYSIGMGIPFILTAIFLKEITRWLSKIEKTIQHLPLISGIIMIIFGLLVFFDQVKKISGLLI